jgi:hypothetical protein
LAVTPPIRHNDAIVISSLASFHKKEKNMSIGSVVPGTSMPATAYAPAASEAGEKTVNGRDTRNDGDADDGVAAAAPTPAAVPAPTVNTSGQTVGTVVNVKA